MVFYSFFFRFRQIPPYEIPLSHPSAPVNTFSIMGWRNCCYLFSYDDDDDQVSGNSEDSLVKLDVDYGVEQYLSMRLTGCCNGLICLTEYSGKSFVLWNPATRKLHEYESDGYLKRFDELNFPHIYHGFGYASSVDDYKYVRILTERREGDENKPIVHIFSVRENRWREIDFGHDPVMIRRPVVHVGEKLYWAANSSQAGNIVVSFDLGTERFDKIKINWVGSEVFGVMGGRLSKCSFTGDKLLHILEPPSILKSICLPKESRLDSSSQMFGFTKAGKCFVMGLSGEEEGFGGKTLGLVDTATKPMQYTSLLRLGTSNVDMNGVVEIWMLKEFGVWESWVKLFKFDIVPGLRSFCGWTLSGKVLLQMNNGSLSLANPNQSPIKYTPFVGE